MQLDPIYTRNSSLVCVTNDVAVARGGVRRFV